MKPEIPVRAHDAPHSAEEQSRLKRALLTVGAGYFLFILADPRDGLAKISIQYILKDHLHLQPAQLAGFIAIIFFAWYLKPVAGLLTDSIPFFGTRRRGYLLGSAIVGGLLWLAIAFAPKTYSVMLWLLLIANVALMIGQTTLGGLMVENGKALHATGRMASQRLAAENCGMVLAGLIGGWLAANFLGIGVVINSVILAGLAVIFFVMIREPAPAKADGKVLRTAFSQLAGLFHHKMMLVATLFWMLVRFSPGFQTPLFFYQTETLKFKPEFIGILTFCNAGCAVLAAFMYAFTCRRFPLRTLLLAGILCQMAATLCYFGYRNSGSAMLIEGIYGFANTISWLPILDLLARATPSRSEALGYSLIFAFGNISLTMCDVFGSWLFQQFGKNFMDLVWVNFGTTALVLIAIPFLPKMLVSTRDGQRALTTAP